MNNKKYIISILIILLYTNSNIFTVKAENTLNSPIKNIELNEMIGDMKYQLLSAQDEITKLHELNYNLKNEISDIKEKQIKELTQNNDLKQKIKDLTENKSFDNQKVYFKALEYMKENKTASVVFYYNLAKAYQDIKNYQQAIENYKIILNIEPDFGKAYCQLGIVYAEIRDYENSIKAFKKYLNYLNNPEELNIIEKFIVKIQGEIK
ncbi:MAG: tetratricopeptide repeat protein [bacterium]